MTYIIRQSDISYQKADLKDRDLRGEISFVMDNDKYILFLTDFSDNSERAFDYTVKFASSIGADIDVLHIVSPEIEAADIPIMSGRVTIQKKDVAADVIEAFINSAKYNNPDARIQIKGTVEIGQIIATINNQLEQKKYDLVSLGTRGENKSKLEKWLGTTSQKVMNKVHCSVLLIPGNIEFRGISQIAFASDLHDSDPFEIWKVSELIKPFFPIIRWIHYMENAMDEEEKIDSLMSFYNGKSPALQLSFHRIAGNRYAREVEEFVDKYDVDLLVMVKYKRNLINRIFEASHTNEMANAINKPLLVVKEGRS